MELDNQRKQLGMEADRIAVSNDDLASGFVSDICHQASVMRVTRPDRDDIAISFAKEMVMPGPEGAHQLKKIPVAILTMSEAQARAVHETLGKVLNSEKPDADTSNAG